MRDYLWVNIKTICRIPLSVFFSVAYPILMMVIMMMSYGNPSIGEGYHLIDKYVMVVIGMGILPLTLVSFSIWVASDIEDDSLKRMLFFKVKFKTIMSAEIIAHLLVGVFCIFIDIAFAKVIFGLNMPGIKYFLVFLIQYFIAVVVCILFGLLLALMLPKTQALMPVGLITMFMMYMFCGAFVSYAELPDKIRRISGFLPIKYAMNDLLNIWMEKQMFNNRFMLISLIYIVALFTLVMIVYYKKYSHWRIKV